MQAYPDDLDQFNIERRRDSFCGKVSVCNNLRQYGYPFSLTDLHTVSPSSDSFKADLRRFAGVCRVINGLKSARFGAVGTRPNAFITVRYSEKLLEAYGIHVCTVDLSEIFGATDKLADGDPKVKTKLDEIKEVKELRSTTGEGYVVLEVEFEPNMDTESALQRVRDKVDQARPEMPADIEKLAKCRPVFEEMPGFGMDSSARSFEELPKEAQDYVAFIEKGLGIKAKIVSVGPGREETIVR